MKISVIYVLSNSLVQECCHLEFNCTKDAIMPALEARKHPLPILSKIEYSFMKEVNFRSALIYISLKLL